MGVGQLAVNFLDHVHGEDVAIRLAGEFVGAVRGAHRNRQRVDLGLLDELDRLVGIGEQLVVGELALGAMAVLLVAHPGLERAQHAELALDRNTAEMGHVGDGPGDADIVVPVARRLAVGLQRTVHHDRGEAGLDRGHAGGGLVAVIEMHADRNLRMDLGHRIHHVPQHDVIGVGTGAARGLDDHRRIEAGGGIHDRERLLHVVDVEGRHAIAVLRRVVEQLPNVMRAMGPV